MAQGGLRAGWDDFTYEVDPSWGKFPAHLQLAPVTAVATDSRDRLYVCHRSDPAILILDPSGELVGTLGDGRITDPHGICIGSDDFVYVVDRDRHQVLIFDPDGGLSRTIGDRDKAASEAPFNHPCDITVAPDGSMFVADGYGNSRIHAFSKEGKHLYSWGEAGRASGRFRVPHGIAVGADERLYVTDRENDRVQVFDLKGNVLAVWDDFKGPTDVCIDSEQRVYVTDHVPRLTVLSPQGDVIVKVRSLHDTHGVCSDSKGNVYVASTAARCVIKYALVR
jgi:DNA-binding beta-propeller fold protein YncE